MDEAQGSGVVFGRPRLNLLGSHEASVDGRPISFRTRKAFALLAYLALDPRPHFREVVAELLWPGGDGSDPRANLRTTLTYLREALGHSAGAILAASRDTVGVKPASVELDIDALRQARQLTQEQPSIQFRREIQLAVSLYRGEFLSWLSFPDAPELEAWIEAQRAYWRNLTSKLLSQLASWQEDAGEGVQALATLEQWIKVDPDEESAWRRLIEMHLVSRDRLSARHAWERYTATVEELDASPTATMSRLHDRITGSRIISEPTRNKAATIEKVARFGRWLAANSGVLSVHQLDESRWTIEASGLAGPTGAVYRKALTILSRRRSKLNL